MTLASIFSLVAPGPMETWLALLKETLEPISSLELIPTIHWRCVLSMCTLLVTLELD